MGVWAWVEVVGGVDGSGKARKIRPKRKPRGPDISGGGEGNVRAGRDATRFLLLSASPYSTCLTDISEAHTTVPTSSISRRYLTRDSTPSSAILTSIMGRSARLD